MAGTLMVAAGVALHRAAPAAFGGAVLIAIAVGRGLSLLASARLRQAGFEMLWARSVRVVKVVRGETIVLDVELRNRGSEVVRASGLRAIASSFLDVRVSPRELELPPESKTRVEVTLSGRRVGRWGVHGLALELRGMPLGGEGLYEVPLVFSNPFGIEVQPRALLAMLRSPVGGRSGRVTDAGTSARKKGEGDELAELREHVVGDAFKRIAWRASARRGRLIVREMERQERDIVWLVLDASVDGWAGAPGTAALDRAVEEVSAVAARHFSKGDQVGLVVFASRGRTWMPPGEGPAHAGRVAAALAGSSTMVDADRCELDESEVAERVAEHLRPLAREQSWPHPVREIDRLAALAESVRARAPFEARMPYAPTPRERALRHYLACFGIEAPPRASGERSQAESELARTLTKLAQERPRPSIVSVWAPAPATHSLVARAVRLLRSKRTLVRWTVLDALPSIGGDVSPRITRSYHGETVASSVDDAVRMRVAAEQVRAKRTLEALGIHPGPRVGKAVLASKPSEDEEPRRGT
jgi:uncharacterized protein (DUF58 family)